MSITNEQRIADLEGQLSRTRLELANRTSAYTIAVKQIGELRQQLAEIKKSRHFLWEAKIREGSIYNAAITELNQKVSELEQAYDNSQSLALTYHGRVEELEIQLADTEE